jgi:hypothetical protein
VSFDHRIGRLTPALTAKQRAMITVRAYITDAPLDPDVRRSMPAEQRPEYDYYMAEIFEQVDGEDLPHADIVAQATEIKTKLLGLLGDLAPRLAKSPPEPDGEVVAGLRKHVDEAMRLMGLGQASL